MKKLTLIMTFIIAMFTSYASEKIEWERYGNPRFNFWVNVPTNFKADPPPENGAGIVLRKGDMEVRYSGGWDVISEMYDEDSLIGQYKFYMEIFEEEGKKVTYEFKGKNYCVLSGKDKDGNIFYYRFIYDEYGKKFVTFSTKYPENKKKYMDNIIKKMTTDVKIYKDREGKEAIEIE